MKLIALVAGITLSIAGAAPAFGQPSATKTPPKTSPQPAASKTWSSLSFVINPAQTKTNFESFIAQAVTSYPEFKEDGYDEEIKGIDFDRETRISLADFGLKNDNLGDVIAAFIITAWQKVNDQKGGSKSYAGTRALVEQNTLKVRPLLVRMDNAKKQKEAQQILFDAALIEMGFWPTSGAGERSDHLVAHVKKRFNVDLKSVIRNEAGFLQYKGR